MIVSLLAGVGAASLIFAAMVAGQLAFMVAREAHTRRRDRERGLRIHLEPEPAPDNRPHAPRDESQPPPATHHAPPACAICGEVHATQPLPGLILRDAACPHCAIVQPVPRVQGDHKPRPWACIQCGATVAGWP